ncbi:MAG: pectinesterase [Myxococcales bacterium]|nr:pectinesterase [Myxococcales bacterium]
MRVRVAPLLLSISILAACGSDEGDDKNAAGDVGVDAPADAGDATSDTADVGGDTDPGDSDTDAAPDVAPDVADAAPDGDEHPAAGLPALDELPLGWSWIETGGETICSRGTPYKFAVRRGTVDKVVFDFMGGGACWNTGTCSISGSIFQEDLSSISDIDSNDLHGIYDAENPENPFRDWTHVFIPYCTGDIHWGDADTTYGVGANQFTIHHRGARNVRTVMDWATTNFDAPSQVFVTGCSAGAYGSVGWVPRIIEAFPDARVAQLGDSGVGIITETFFQDSFPQWNALPLLPEWIPALDPAQVDIYSLTLSDLYLRLAQFYPDVVFSQFTSAYDNNQAFYFSAMGGGDQFVWSEFMFSRIAVPQEAANYAYFIGPGEDHCVLPYDEFYTAESNGTTLLSWVQGLIDGENPGTVVCTGDCGRPQD